jgi:sugar phosphate isomerase/epimerase
METRRNVGVVIVLFMLATGILGSVGSVLARASNEPMPFRHIIIDCDNPTYPHCKAVGDINGDGYVDVLAASAYGQGLYWYSWPHWTKHRIAGGSFTTDMQVGDVDRDGDLDVIIPPGGVGLVWFENPRPEGDPATTAWRMHRIDREGAHDLEVGDVDGDGRLDVVVRHGRTRVFLQQSPDFWRKIPIPTGGRGGTALGDLDGDGDLDILQKDFQQERRVDVWLNGGTRPGANGIGTSASFRGPVGLQLYSLRDIFKDDVPLGLQYTRNFGFVEVELAGTYGLTPAQFLKRLQWYGLKPIGGHWSYEQWENDPAAVVKEAKALGLPYAGCAWIPHEGAFDEATCRRAAAVFNQAGAVAAAQGIKFYYHNHGYEFVPHGESTLFDLLVQQTRPELVTYEMDVFWTVHPGQDPIKLLRRYPTRWDLFHIKDLKKGVATGKLTGSEDVRNDVTLGTGQIDLPQILRTAQEIGVKHYFIEDESPTATTQIPQSLRYLQSLSW